MARKLHRHSKQPPDSFVVTGADKAVVFFAVKAHAADHFLWDKNIVIPFVGMRIIACHDKVGGDLRQICFFAILFVASNNHQTAMISTL